MRKFYDIYDTEILRKALGSITDEVIEFIEKLKVGTEVHRIEKHRLTIYKPDTRLVIFKFDYRAKATVYHISCRYLSDMVIIDKDLYQNKKAHSFIKLNNIYVPWMYKMMDKLNSTNYVSEVYNRRTGDKVIESITHARCTKFEDGLKWLVVNTITPEEVTGNMSILFAPEWVSQQNS